MLASTGFAYWVAKMSAYWQALAWQIWATWLRNAFAGLVAMLVLIAFLILLP